MNWLTDFVGNIQFTSWIFQRCIAVVYFLAFASALEQFPALLGERGMQPVPDFLKARSFMDAPSLFHIRYSDRLLKIVCGVGLAISAALIFALTDSLPWGASLAAWLCLWALYLSIVNVGQTFYAFGWESMLLEAGFFAAFLGPASMVANAVPYIILRWMLFRVELGAGLIKLRNDECWRDLTALYYHHETQPLPNPLSWYFHRLPKALHRGGVAFSHLVQVAMPFFLFAPQPLPAIAGSFIIAHQLLLIVSGNYSWLNWITVFLGFTAFNDQVLSAIPGINLPILYSSPAAYPSLYDGGMGALLGIVFFLSIPPTLNLFAKSQLMNYSYNPFHIVNTYGAFGSMSRERYEVIIEGTEDSVISDRTVWKPYEFKAKVGDVSRVPPQVAPYHLRLDWLMWFIPFSVSVHDGQLMSRGYERWFLGFIFKLLQGDKQMLKLLRSDPFRGAAPQFVRAQYYQYRFTSADEHKETGAWWDRVLIGAYLPPVKLANFEKISPVRSFR